MCLSIFFNKVADLRPRILLEKRLQHRFFSLRFSKFLRAPFFKEHLRWQLLTIFLVTLFRVGVVLSVAYLTVANLARLGIAVHC